MSRNRRSESAAMWLVPTLKASLLCALLGGSAVGYVMQKNILHELGRTITQREAKLERLRAENKLKAQHLAYLQSPTTIEHRVHELKLALGKPQGPTIWLREPMPDSVLSNSTAVFVLNSTTPPKP
jgi:hypothetical protein